MPEPFVDLQGQDWFSSDAVLDAIVKRDVRGPWAEQAGAFLQKVAVTCQNRVAPLAWIADRQSPTLRTHDPFGQRIDEVVYHPAYGEMARIAYEELGLVAMKYDGSSFGMPEPAPQTLGFAAAYLFAQAEAGLTCPLCMTDGAARVIALFGDEAQRRDLLPRLISRDPRTRTTGAMFLTEKTGGSDVGLSQTRADKDGNGFRISGDKWFCSNVDAGIILTLARVDPRHYPDYSEVEVGADREGTDALGLFVLEPYLPDGRRNGMTIHRLKEKLGVRSMPTGEVTFENAWGRQLGPLRSGFKSMAEMINISRLYNAVCSVAIMRRSLVEALGWISARQAFGRRVVDHPLAIENIVDLSAEAQGAFHLVFEVVRRLGLKDQCTATATDLAVQRFLTPLCKYYTAKLSVASASEAMELCGGNGYIEEFVTARLLRDAQVLPIWEGTTNICVLDALRALRKPGTAEAFFNETERKLVAISNQRLRPMTEIARRHMDRLQRSLLRLQTLSTDVLLHHARPFTDALIQGYQVVLALSEADRMDEQGQGGRDFLVAERLLTRHLERPSLETVGPRHIDPLRLQVLLGERSATIAEVD